MENPIEIHPALAVIPDLDAEDLQSLVRSISEQGQLHPVVLDANGLVLDGRGRLLACEILGIEPATTIYSGTAPAAFTAAVNLEGRSLTKGQKAMIYAKTGVFPETPEAVSRKTDTSVSEETITALSEQAGVSRTRMSFALTVLRFAPDLVDLVIDGVLGLNEAYKTARERKLARDAEVDRLATVRAADPVLAQRVADREITLAAAMTELRQREERAREERRRATEGLCDLVPALAQHQGGEVFTLYDGKYALAGREVTRELIAQAISALGEMDLVWQARELA